MAELFAERMRYLLSEMTSLGDDELFPGFPVTPKSAIVKKVAASLDKFQSALGDGLHRHDSKIRKVEEALRWMKELEETIFAAEDALGNWRVKYGELATRRTRMINANSALMITDTVQCCIPVCCLAFATADASMGLEGFASSMETQVEKLLLKGKKLVDKMTKLKSSFPEEDDPGLMVSSVREGDKNRVLEHLLPPDPENGCKPQVVSIVGFGGSGKTALARSLHNHPSVEQHFQVRVWVRVSNIFDERKMATNILDSLQVPYSKELELEPLLQLLQDSFSGKTVLVVFDDVWGNDVWGSKLWDEAFKKCEVGSRILVTTRSGGAGIVHTLAPLLTNDCLLILKSSADVERLMQGLEETSWIKLAERCKGSPLVAKILGMKLRSKDTRGAVELNEEHMEEICMVCFPQLYNTYNSLLPHMKACLLCCAHFPKSTDLDSEKIITLWMSQGYLGYHTATIRASALKLLSYSNVKRKGIECLIGLIGHSFFERIASHSIHKPSSDIRLMCKMPDEVHDFVTYMARVHDDDGRIFSNSPEKPLTPDLFGQMVRMTALVLSSCQLCQLPDEVRLLSRLQYLDLSDNLLKQLPPTICELYYLEYLDVHFCYFLSSLPKNIGELKQMRHLRINHTTDELHDLPSGFNELTLMRTLDVFRVGGKYKDAEKTLRLLRYLVDICIVVHGEVDLFSTHLEDADLPCNVVMVNLELSFVGEGRNKEIADSTNRMVPPPNLEMLKFEHYPGLKLPRWILSKSLINKLKRLSLRSAANISSLPALWKLSSLEFLWLYDIPKLKHLGCEFFGREDTVQDAERGFIEANDGEITVEASGHHPETERREAVAFSSLKILRIEYLENWETWEDVNETDEFDIKVMPCLEELIIAHCPKLQGRPRHILKDTPWFKNSYTTEVENAGEAREKNMKHPSQKDCSSPPDGNKNKGANAVLKASYIKLKNFVHDAYMTKAPAQPLKVSIPEGVLGKTRVTSYLPLDSLHVWFEEDRSIFSEQLCVWSKHIYELMTPSDKVRVQMASSALIKTVGRQEHSSRKADNLIDFMMENKAKIYLVPFLRPGHWELLAIVPETEVIYWFDPQQRNISQELTEFLNMVGRKFFTRNLNSATAHDSWKVVDIKHKRQVDNWECGYYVMIWMQKIALEIHDINLESHFPTDATSYEPDKLTEVDWKWCEHVMPSFRHNALRSSRISRYLTDAVKI